MALALKGDWSGALAAQHAGYAVSFMRCVSGVPSEESSVQVLVRFCLRIAYI